MISVRVQEIGTVKPSQVSGMMLALDRGVMNLTPVWPRLVTRIHSQEARKFTTENASGPSGRWAGYKNEAYARRKALRYPGRPILTASGALRASLDSDAAGSLIQYTPTSLFVGTTVPYAIYHQQGTARMPSRPPVDVSNRDVSEYTADIWRYIESVKVKAGFKGRFAGAMS